MLTDLILAILHHLLMFTLVAVLVAEIMLVRPEITTAHLRRVEQLDAAYGAAAGLILVVGFGRVFLGLKGAEFYLTNPVFWAKIAAFLVVGLLSVPPTLRILGWRAQRRQNPDFTPAITEVRAIRRFMHWEAAVFVLIPIFAAMMARGYGF
jgi:putative membrane protein